MMTLHFAFQEGNWERGTMYTRGTQPDGWSCNTSMDLRLIDAAHKPALQEAITALVSLGAEWRANQVWATLAEVDKKECIQLTVEAIQTSTNRVKMLHPTDCPAFTLRSPSMVAFFKHYTTV